MPHGNFWSDRYSFQQGFLSAGESGEFEPNTAVIIRDNQACRWYSDCPRSAAMTILGTVSEDPTSWEDICLVWMRYWTPLVSEFPESLPFQDCMLEQIPEFLGSQQDWIFVDLSHRRLLVGKALSPMGRKLIFMLGNEDDGIEFPVPFCLPPWWVMREGAESAEVVETEPGGSPAGRTRRDILYGDDMRHEFANSVLSAAQQGKIATPERRKTEFLQACTELIKDLHRDWLMKPRGSIGGRTVRELLTFGIGWQAALIEGQVMRCQHGAKMAAIPSEIRDFANLAPGREEVITYFNLCRELIAQALLWCNGRYRKTGRWPTRNELPKLKKLLADLQQTWMKKPSELGTPPDYVIDCSRRRIPQAPGMSILGFDRELPADTFSSCECPICQMMGTGGGVTGVTMLSGHHLELEGEFAFSMAESLEDWETDKWEMAKEIEQWESEHHDENHPVECEAECEAEFESEDEADRLPAGSVWKTSIVNGEIPGDSRGHLSLAFRLAEIVGWLQGEQDTRSTIREINDCFRRYRESSREQVVFAREKMFTALERAAEMLPAIQGQVADFQSLVFDYERQSPAQADG